MDTVTDAWEYEYGLGTRANADIPIEWGTNQKATQSYGNMLTSLTPGVIYYVRVRAHNGRAIATGVNRFRG